MRRKILISLMAAIVVAMMTVAPASADVCPDPVACGGGGSGDRAAAVVAITIITSTTSIKVASLKVLARAVRKAFA